MDLSTSSARTATRAQLYELARDRGVPGASRMSKAELAEHVASAASTDGPDQDGAHQDGARADSRGDPALASRVEAFRELVEDVVRFADEAAERLRRDHAGFVADHAMGALRRVDVVYR
jgi:hypothetical protein